MVVYILNEFGDGDSIRRRARVHRWCCADAANASTHNRYRLLHHLDPSPAGTDIASLPIAWNLSPHDPGEPQVRYCPWCGQHLPDLADDVRSPA